MPTKLNRAGQQQNYVPQGNGDASGEYADHASGSNKHFTNFAKPEEKSFSNFAKTEEQTTEQPKEENKYLGGSKAKTDFYLSLITSGILKNADEEEWKQKLKDTIAKANEESLEAISITMSKKPFEFTEDRFNAGTSYFYEAQNQIHIDKDQFGRGFEEQGSPLFHELAHYMNATNRIKEKKLWYYDYNKLTDASTIFDDTISVADSLQIELNDFAAAKHAVKIRKEKRKFVDEKLKQYGFTSQEYEKLAEQQKAAVESEEWQTIKARIKNDFDNGDYSSVAEANKALKARFEEWKKTGSYKELFSKIKEMRPLYSDACNEWYKMTGIQAISDAWSSRSDFGFGLGHQRSYYNKSRSNTNPASLIADEFFANFFAAYTTNDKPALETTQKYFPETCKKMLELIKYIRTPKENGEK